MPGFRGCAERPTAARGRAPRLVRAAHEVADPVAVGRETALEDTHLHGAVGRAAALVLGGLGVGFGAPLALVAGGDRRFKNSDEPFAYST